MLEATPKRGPSHKCTMANTQAPDKPTTESQRALNIPYVDNAKPTLMN